MRSILASLLLLAACGEVATPSTPVDAADHDTPVVVPIDAAIDAVPQIAHWVRIAGVQATLDFGNRRGFLATSHGSKIYFAPIADSEPLEFHAFDVGTLQLSAPLALPPGAQTDFHAAGFGAVFVADTLAVYLIGDQAQRYDPSTNAWTLVPGYGRAVSRGEADGTYHPQTATIYMIGGRDFASNSYQPTAIRLASGVWEDEPGMLPYAVSHGMAYALPGDERLFVAGGRASDNNRRHLAVHRVGLREWDALPDAPSDLSDANGMGHMQLGGSMKLLAVGTDRLYLFDLATSSWDAESIAVPGDDFKRLVMVAGTPHALVRNGASAEVYKLVEGD